MDKKELKNEINKLMETNIDKVIETEVINGMLDCFQLGVVGYDYLIGETDTPLQLRLYVDNLSINRKLMPIINYRDEIIDTIKADERCIDTRALILAEELEALAQEIRKTI